MKTRLTLALALLGFTLIPQATPLAAQDAEEESPFADFEAISEDADLLPGFFDMYTKEGKVWMAVPEDVLSEGFMLDTRVARGIGASGLFGGSTLDYFEMALMAIEQHGERVYLMQRPHQFMAAEDERAQAAVDITFSSSVVESADIAATRPDGALVIDVTDWFLSDLSGVSNSANGAAGGSANFDRGRSFLESVESFPDNTNVRATLTFRAGGPPQCAGCAVRDDDGSLHAGPSARKPDDAADGRRSGGQLQYRPQGLQLDRLDLHAPVCEPLAARAGGAGG